MPYENPYESPSIPAGMLKPAWPTSGVYRDGDLLVMKAGNPLPPICVCTGSFADTNLQVNLQCRGANDASVPSTHDSIWSGKQYTIDVPIDSQWIFKKRKLLLISSLLFLSGFGLLLGGIIYFILSENADRQNWGWTSVAVVVMLGFASYLQDLTKPVRFILTISRGFIWIAGANPLYLQQLPEWPAPKLSYWERFWI